MPRVTMYATGSCPYCHRAEALLRSKGIAGSDLELIRVDEFPQRREEMMTRSGRRTVPQIWIGERHVGGCDDLHALDQAGELDVMLAA
jgi:glutaredoxin 3